LSHAQHALGAPGHVEQVLVSNRGGETGGIDQTSAVIARLRPVLAPLGLEAHDLKRDGLQQADEAGDAFVQMFSTFGSFSIAAGILLIFLIFVMLAAERRTEMGVARAIGTQRGHLVQTFVFEGAAYDVIAAAVGAALGVGVSMAMVAIIGKAFAAYDIEFVYSVKWPSVVAAYALGVLITLAVVGLSAWRVSVLNIVTAVRGLPDQRRVPRRRRRLAAAVVPLTAGALLIVSGRASSQAMPFLVGVSLVAIGLVPVLRAAGVSERAAFTVAGVVVTGVWLLPFRFVETLVPGAQMNFSMWIAGGLLVVLGASWTVIYNADALMGATSAVLGRVRALSAVLRISMAYPLRTRLRTGMTLAMFTLVVFNLVVGVTTAGSFIHSSDNAATYGGGFDVRAMTAPVSPIADMATAVRSTPSLARDVRSIASVSYVPVRAAQANTGRAFVDYPLRGLDAAFLAQHRYALGSRARGYATDRRVWDAVADGGRFAVVDPWIVPHRRNWAFGAITDMRLSGFFAEDRGFAPVPLDVRDPETGRTIRFTIIGVLRDTMPFEMAGIATSQSSLAPFGRRATPTMYLFSLRAGVDGGQFAHRLESAFLGNGLEADTFTNLVHDATASSMTFLRLIEGFMGLGLVVGVAALGVIAARSVVERRQQIGVLRAIGFQARAVRLGFLLESLFLAGSSIALGSFLGLLLSYNIVDDARRQATWPGVHLTIPWTSLAVIFATVLFVALATTYLPARKASRVYAAEALRYE
jgi:putative ABC transport system permease protein